MIAATRKEILQKKLTVLLTGFVDYIVAENAQFRTDASRVAEDIMCELLNTAFGCKLRNLNVGKQTPGLDLGEEDGGLCYQVTAEVSSSKVRDTLDHCKVEGHDKTYAKIRILFISTKKNKKLADFDLKKKAYDFIDKVDTLNVTQLITEISQQDLEKLEAAVQYLDLELLQVAPTESDLPIVGEIIDYAIENASKVIDPLVAVDRDHLLKLSEKIKLNFDGEEEREAVEKYMELALLRFDFIKNCLEIEHPDEQDDLQVYMQYLYNKHKLNTELTPAEVLQEMINEIVPASKKNDPRSLSWATALVLFYFDDCSIFKRTPEETQASLFGAVT